MEVGKKYKRFMTDGVQIAFSFGVMVGKFSGLTKDGWLKFDVGNGKECFCQNDCRFEEVIKEDEK